MAAINLLTRQPVIPFIRVKKEEDLKEVTLTNAVIHMVTPAGGGLGAIPLTNKRTANFVIAYDDDVETLLRLCLSYMEAIEPDGLALGDGQLYTEFRKCLRDIVLENYDGLLDAVMVRDRNNFRVLLTQLVSLHTTIKRQETVKD